MALLSDRCSKCGRSPPEGLKACSKCHGATGIYCSKECQVAHWKLHKKICHPLSDGEVWGIKILDNRYAPWSRQFQHVLLKKTHPVFTVGELCPVTDLCGMPLLILSERVHGGHRALNDNQPAVYLRIEPDNALAPMHWQIDSVGMCIVARKDRKPLTLEAIEIIYKFHSHLIHTIDDERLEDGSRWKRPISPEWLREFADEYREKETRQGRLGFDYFP
ncbi:hypothetical protein BN946_scf184998.g40 [Trametes cinnabarina]|uniref:MYND-type domain-containing protein n=1 Tax=Pycnoporus cinnabarinus TaxID=5643 RepID=A0A060S826_PYCCI|nr:hypothetical protein BN946_scf184998.g40 [Trametes cinnabarina]